MQPIAALPADAELAEALIAAVIKAGKVILEARERGLGVEKKEDASLVTEADRAAEALILKRLAAVAPDVPVVAEEAVAAGKIPKVTRAFFLVDPLDGTREFVRGGSDFTVNIGLVRDGRPVVGVILAPATGALYAGVVGLGAWRARVEAGSVVDRRPIHTRPTPVGPMDVVASRSHRTPATDAVIARYRVGRLVAAGSSIKFCVVAAGEADLYPRMGATMQWDTAAGDAILRAAGGKVVTLDGKPLAYGPSDAPGAKAYENPWFIATGGMDPILD
jgi:3'(2'),5'-bisphosphate nucleotidase